MRHELAYKEGILEMVVSRAILQIAIACFEDDCRFGDEGTEWLAARNTSDCSARRCDKFIRDVLRMPDVA